MGYQDTFSLSEDLKIIEYVDKDIERSTFFILQKKREAFDRANIAMEKSRLLPDISINYFRGTNTHENSKIYHGFEAGVAIPLFFNAQRSKIRASKITLEATKELADYERDLFMSKKKELQNSCFKYKELLDQYNSSGKSLCDELKRTSQLSYEKGEIDFQKFAINIENAMQIKKEYLDNLLHYTRITLNLNYLSE